MSLKREIALFAVGGALGFVVDAGIVETLVWRGWNPYSARVVSFLAAATVTWAWNRRLTFAHRRRHAARAEWLRWIAVMVMGALLNYGIYALLVHASLFVRAWPVLGVAVGSLAGAVVNFIAARRVVFPAPRGT